MFTRVFSIALGLSGIGFAIAQYMAALGRIDPEAWPFVRSESKALRIAAAVVSAWLGAALIFIGVAGSS